MNVHVSLKVLEAINIKKTFKLEILCVLYMVLGLLKEIYILCMDIKYRQESHLLLLIIYMIYYEMFYGKRTN